MPTRVLLFAYPKELLQGAAECSVTLEGASPSLADLRARLAEAFPALLPVLPSCAFAVEATLIPQSLEASTAAPPTVALIPPVSGG